MVNTDGQLYTIEGMAAGLILLLTAYIVVNSTSVYTLGDTHISDMQLEVLGSDAITMMNTAPNSTIGKSPLQTIVEQDNSETFRTMFLNIVNNRTGPDPDRIQFMANVTYLRTDNSVNSTPLGMSRNLTGGEHAAHVSEWVIVDKIPGCSVPTCNSGKHAVLVEVLLWRD